MAPVFFVLQAVDMLRSPVNVRGCTTLSHNGGQERNDLQRLSQTHIVAENCTKAFAIAIEEELDAVSLVRTQVLVDRSWNAGCGLSVKAEDLFMRLRGRQKSRALRN